MASSGWKSPETEFGGGLGRPAPLPSTATKSPARALPTRPHIVSHTFSRAKAHTFPQHHSIHTAFPIKTESLQRIPKLSVRYAGFNITPANAGAAGLIATIHNLPAAAAELNFPLSIPKDPGEGFSSPR